MRIFPILCVSVALLYAVVNGDHNGEHQTHGHKIASINDEFTFNLYKQIASEQLAKNIFISSLCISAAFAMLSLGSKAKTHDQVLHVLGFNISEVSEQEIHDGFQHLLNDKELNSGNALFIRKELKLMQSFLEEIKNFYKTEAISIDFQNTEVAKSEINSYVEKKTNGKIDNFLSSVEPDTVLLLVNYIFFRGEWQSPFNEANTREDDFNVDENTIVKVPMMFRNGYYKWAFDDKLSCTVVEIPCKGNTSSLFILPDQGKLKQVENALQKSTIKHWKKLLNGSRIELYLPKFSISTSLDLKSELSKLGVTDLFSDYANLSGITGAQDVKVSKALQKAVLNIDERGSEPAGHTVAELVSPMMPILITFNRPFLLFIVTPNNINFMGKVVNPTE